MVTMTIKNANRTQEPAKRPQKFVVKILEREKRRGAPKNSRPHSVSFTFEDRSTTM